MGRARSVNHDADGERHGWRWRRREASRDSRSARFSRRDIWECKYTYRTFAVARTWVVVESVNADIMASSSNNGAARVRSRDGIWASGFGHVASIGGMYIDILASSIRNGCVFYVLVVIFRRITEVLGV